MLSHRDEIREFKERPESGSHDALIMELEVQVNTWKRHYEDIRSKYHNKRLEFGLDMIRHLTTLGLRGDALTDTYASVMIMFDNLKEEI
jgi:hypothetical protein